MKSNEEKEFPQRDNSTKLSSINSEPYIELESHLQSPGCLINNGKARFNLDEDASFFSKVSLSGLNIVDSDDSLSFVVLDKDSLHSIQQSSIASYTDIQQKSLAIDYNSIIASWDTSVVHQTLNELLQENTKLKETLKQNNIAMKQQFNTLVAWQEEIMRIHQDRKKKFAETRELINYLRKQNTELKMKISSKPTSHSRKEYMMLIMKELQPILDESNKEDTLLQEPSTFESTENFIEVEEENTNSKRLSEEERIAVDKERENLEEEKKLYESRKNELEIEYKNLNEAKETLQLEVKNLQEEKASVEAEKDELQTKCNALISELGIIHESIRKKELQIKNLVRELMEYKEEIRLSQVQIGIYEEDFKQLKTVKELLVEEQTELNSTIQEQARLIQVLSRICNVPDY
ncbi:hypothetical protein WN48_04633 [Eufriesea mexicana]|uniref:NF-kappa-B essential modulator NEMO N-terminal domain-containing protein n=1 Tax=Eufriesea mexicana TaxID=516756 RepID=A0A310SDP1_9HYME|nr:PREDICTED: optineurin-like [Eufriesea mexicana]OAD55531.1 hypothetical protein WN48_04633 [Eufriesea mexicana]